MAFSIKPSMGLQAHPGLLPDLFQDDWLAAANVHESFMHQPVESSGLEISRMSHGNLFNLSHGNLYLMGASHEEEPTELDFNLDPDPLISLDAEMERFITSMEAVAPVDHLQARCDLLQDRCPDRSSGETQRDGGSSSGGAQSTDTVDTEDHEIRKQQALERNARAQKKFRERQKAKRMDNQRKVEDLTRQLNALRMEKDAMESRLTHALKAKEDPQGDAVLEFDPAARGYEAEAMLTFSIREDQPPYRTCARQLTSLPPEVIHRLWKEYITAFGKLLPLAQLDESSPAAQRLTLLVNEYNLSSVCLQLGDAKKMRALLTLRLDNGCVFSQQPPRATLEKIVSSLNLTPTQCMRLTEVRRQLLNNLAVLRQQRLELEALLQKSLQQQNAWVDKQNVFSQVCTEFLQVNEVTDKLAANLVEDTNCLFQFFWGVHTTLTAIQTASFRVQCDPFRAYLMAICNVVAVWAGEEEEGIFSHNPLSW